MASLLRPAPVLVLAALALALVVCWPALAGPPGPVEVTVEKPDGKVTAPVLASQVDPDITGPYTVRQADGTTTQVEVQDGVSIRKLLEESQSELGYGTLEITRPGGGVVTLTREQVDAATPRPPVLYSDEAGATWFLRSPSDGEDVNAGDHFQVTSGALAIKQTAAELTVKVSASRKKIDPGESITFTTTVSGGPPGVDYIYDWNFDDGERIAGGGRRETHEFAKEGFFDVLVAVTIVGKSRSDSGVVKVQVGDGKESEKDRDGGGDNTADGAPDSGSSTGTGGYDSGGYDSGGYTPYTPPPAPAPAPAPTPAPAPAPDSSLTPDIETSGTPVEGNLLADVSDPPPQNLLESAARAARDGKRKSSDADGGGVSEAAISIAGVLALLGLGAGIENRQGRPLRPRLPRRAA